jgi:pimeloyl-ACP methyl ester carboxylesterase
MPVLVTAPPVRCRQRRLHLHGRVQGPATTDIVRPFRVEVPEQALEDLRRRLAAVRWPSRELVAERTGESGRAQALAAGQAPPPVAVPVGFTTFPDEIFQAPRSWVEQAYPTLSYFHHADQGGHFAAWEQPDLFTTEIQATFRPLR